MLTRSLEYMFPNLNANLQTFTAVDIAEMEARLVIMFVDGEPIEPFLATKNETTSESDNHFPSLPRSKYSRPAS